MTPNRLLVLCLIFLTIAVGSAFAAAPAVKLTEVGSGLSSPLDMKFAPGHTDRFYVTGHEPSGGYSVSPHYSAVTIE